MTLDGVLLADKPAGITSHDVVARARRALKQRRIGHAGTLDPFATGLLLLLVGRATRTQTLMLELDKSYEVVAQLGARSTTGDPEGEVEHTGKLPAHPFELPTGWLRQRPPAHSAVKVDGERAYRRARRGEEVTTAERSVHVAEFTELWRRDDRAAFRIVCSSGTYVRSLVADLGDAYCLELRRTRIGPFEVEGAWPADGTPSPMPLEQALALLLPSVRLDAAAARAAGHGRAVEGPGDEPRALLLDDQGAIAIAERREGGELKPVVVLRG